MVKTIVTMDMGEQIAGHYGVRTVDVLTGFKFIGEQIGRLEQQGKADSYVFGFEESYGYLTGSYVRDKDGVDGAYMICEMFSYYKTHGVSLLEKLGELYRTYGLSLIHILFGSRIRAGELVSKGFSSLVFWKRTVVMFIL